jgi:flavin-dependent dehydrogenase
MAKGELTVDVLILGAGPAGCATALGLLAAGISRVLLVDRPLALPFHIGESATPDVGRLLARLGVETDLCRLGHRAYYSNLSRWGEGPPILDHFLSRGWDHGWHLDRGAFDSWLRAEATARGARLVHPATLTSILPYANGWRVTADGYGHVRARVVVDAAGRKAPLASRLGARRHRIDSLIALAVRSEAKPSDRLAGLSVVEAFRDGWWYAAPLPSGGAIVMLTTDQDIAAVRRFRNPEVFAQVWRRTDELAQLVPPPCQPYPITIYPAFSGFINRAAGPGWIAVGDALIAFDPLTSSGIAGALSDALSALPVILAELDTGKADDAARTYSRSADATLKRYLGERQHRYNTERRWSESAFWARRAGSRPDQRDNTI